MKHWVKIYSLVSPDHSHLIYRNTDKTAKIAFFAVSKRKNERIKLQIFGDDDAVNNCILEYYNSRPAVKKNPWSKPGSSVFTIAGGFEVEVGIHAIKATHYISLEDRAEISKQFGLFNLFYDEGKSDRYAIAFAQLTSFEKARLYVEQILAKQNGESSCAFALAEYYLRHVDLLSAVKLYAMVPEENENYPDAHQLINQLTEKLIYKSRHGLTQLLVNDYGFIYQLNLENKSKFIRLLSSLDEEQKVMRIKKIGGKLSCFIEDGNDLIKFLTLFTLENRMMVVRYLGAKLKDIVKDDLQLGYIRSCLPQEHRTEFSTLADAKRSSAIPNAFPFWRPSVGGAEQQANKVARRLLDGKEAVIAPPTLRPGN